MRRRWTKSGRMPDGSAQGEGLYLGSYPASALIVHRWMGCPKWGRIASPGAVVEAVETGSMRLGRFTSRARIFRSAESHPTAEGRGSARTPNRCKISTLALLFVRVAQQERLACQFFKAGKFKLRKIDLHSAATERSVAKAGGRQ